MLVPINRDTHPHLSEAQREAVERMAHMLGIIAVRDLLAAEPSTHVQRIDNFLVTEAALNEKAKEIRENARREAMAEAKATAEGHYAELEAQAAAQVEAARQQGAQEGAEAARQEGEARLEAALAGMRASARETPTPRASPQDTRKPVRLDVPRYSGKEGENLSHWLVAVRMAIQAQLIEDQRLMVAFAMSFLDGRAKEWSYSRLMEDERSFGTWSAFVAAIKATFQPPHSEMRSRARFLSCRQGKRSLHDYVQELRFLSAACLEHPIPEPVKVTIFMEGLRSGPARTQLFRAIPSTMEEGIAVSMMEEHSYRSATGAGFGSSGATPMDLCSAETPRTEAVCFNCGKPGHYKRDCRLPRQERGRNGNFRNGGSNSGGNFRNGGSNSNRHRQYAERDGPRGRTNYPRGNSNAYPRQGNGTPQ